ncbi:MAG: tetratricopeptide repeat protein [Sandaracinaceae bacterium]
MANLRRVLALSSLALVLLGSAPRASAQSAASEQQAHDLFDQGRAEYDAGRFAEASQLFRRAYLLTPRYPLLYNIGQAELRAGRDASALEAFESFLRVADADDARRPEVTERVRILRSMGVAPTEGGEAPRDSHPPPPDDGGGSNAVSPRPGGSSDAGGGGGSPAGWIVLGVGGAVLVAGAVLMGVAASDTGSVTDAPDGSMWPDIESKANTINAMWGAGLALGIVGVVAVGVGLAWGIADSSGGEGASAQLRVGPGSVAIEGTF